MDCQPRYDESIRGWQLGCPLCDQWKMIAFTPRSVGLLRPGLADHLRAKHRPLDAGDALAAIDLAEAIVRAAQQGRAS